MICASEQSVTVLADIYDEVKKEFAARGCYFLKDDEIDKVRKTILINGSLNARIVGQSAYKIAQLAGVEVPEKTKVLIGEVESLFWECIKQKHLMKHLQRLHSWLQTAVMVILLLFSYTLHRQKKLKSIIMQ